MSKAREGALPNAEDIAWFKKQFHSDIEGGVAGTPFSLDFLSALACQETGEVWPILRKVQGMRVDKIVALCVGDTLDAPKRSAFPKTKAALVAKPHGQEMFDIAHRALVDMAVHIKSYRGAASRPNKFCHGYGVWQYDLQFFLEDPQYFLQKRYEQLGQTLGKAVGELRSAQRKIGLRNRSSLTDLEMAHVAIAYNTGRFVPSRGLKQGFKPPGGRFYGEQIFDFILLSKTVPVPGRVAPLASPTAGNAIVAAPTPLAATGAHFVAATRDKPLRLRSEPRVGRKPGANVLTHLPDGHPVRAVRRRKKKGFVEVETQLFGAHFRGFVAAEFLRATSPRVAAKAAADTAPVSGVVSVTMPRRPGSVTKRTDRADAHSLNEPNQPGRKRTTPVELVSELNTIVDYLNVEKASHKRYQPRDGLTFCNIYTHDFCHLAGAYLPRVWWTQRAIIDLAQGKKVEPLIGNTIREMRANDIFRWLREFGETFGWRQTSTLTNLQQNANQGGLGLIIARRREEGRPGHMVMVVPEADSNKARRNRAGDVTAPLQSQAGSRNFNRSPGTLNWWMSDRFAESAFWIHS